MTETIQLRVLSIIRETELASTFILEEINQQAVPYKPGQFLTFLFNFHGHEVRRSYSFSSTPGIDENMSITLKRVQNGEISRYMLDRIKPGDILTALPPAGIFVPAESISSKRDVFLLAAGSGITPIFSILKYLLQNEPDTRIILIFQNRSKEETIFRTQLEKLVPEYRDRVVWVDMIIPRLNNDQLEIIIKHQLRFKKEDALFYLCGPVSFMRMCQFTIMVMKFSRDQIRKEFFTIDTAPPPPLLNDTSTKHVLVKGKKEYSFTTAYPKTILESALDQKIALPYNCRNGRCSTCVARCVSGEVKMSINEILTDKDLADGLVLTCVGYACSDIELQFD